MKTTQFLLVLTLLVAALLVGCEKKDDAAAIRALGAELVASAEKQDISGMFEHATSDFVANPGGRDEQGARQILFVAFRRYGSLDVVHPSFDVTIDESGRGATLAVPFTIVREGQSFDQASVEKLVDDPTAWAQAVGEAVGDPYHLKLSLRKEVDDWKIWKADLTSFSQGP